MKFTFGDSSSTRGMVINADTIEEAKREFAFSCGDISKYTIKGNPFQWDILNEPYGFTDGKPNAEFNLPNFYQRVNISIEDINENGHRASKVVGMITAQEIEVILATPQHALLTQTHSSTLERSEGASTDIRPSRGIMMLQQQGRAIQLGFRNKQLELVHLKAQSSLQMAKYDRIRRESENEQRKIQEKINVLQTYSGIGKDLIKVCSGKNSKAEKITIFQSFRYMREDIELLSDFEEFDFRTLEAFDEFLANNYKELIPTDLSIQAFKISKFPILYKSQNMFGQNITEKDDRNDLIFIIIRNGDNVYRMFNKYRFNGKLFHSENELENVIKKAGAFAPSDMEKIQGAPVEFWEIQGNTDKSYSYRTVRIPSASAFYPDLDTGILENEFNRCKSNYEAEMARRQKYIDDNELSGLLSTTSWRWGKYIGAVKLKMFKNYHETFSRMYMKEAFKTKDYATCGALGCTFINNVFEVDAIDGDNIYEGEMYLYRYASHQSDDKNAIQKFNPLTGAAFKAEVVRCSDEFLRDGFFDAAREHFMKRVWEKTDELHLLNFHSVAILQNILDNRKIFPDHEVDFITGDGMESVHRVYDDENMIQSRESKERISPDELINKVLTDTFALAKYTDRFYLLRNYEMRISYSGSRYRNNEAFEHSLNTSDGDKPFVATAVEMISQTKSSITVEGMIDEWKRDSWRKGIYAGDSKMGKATIKAKDNFFGSKQTIVSVEAIKENEKAIKEMMGRREF
ncbi:MAG: hypothetical protein PHV62_03385, partial [Sulfuricurvum sp.]|nr:hypothetical protein [Sulfuricurvum sp.]